MKRKNIIIVASIFVVSVLIITLFSGCSIGRLAFNSMQKFSQGMHFKRSFDHMDNRGYKGNGNGSNKGGFRNMPCNPESKNSGQGLNKDLENTPFMGIEMTQSEDAVTGVLVNSVISGSPAQKAGIKALDIITAADGREVKSPADLLQSVLGHKVGDTIKVTINRSGQSQELSVTLEPMSNVIPDTENENQSSENFKGCGNCPGADKNQNGSNDFEKSGQKDNETY